MCSKDSLHSWNNSKHFQAYPWKDKGGIHKKMIPCALDSEKKRVFEEWLVKTPDSQQIFGGTEGIVLDNLRFEPLAARKPGSSEKALFYFGDSKSRIITAGYERHPFSAEAFKLLCAYLDDELRAGKGQALQLTPEQTNIAKDMLTSHGEFFCQAVETRKGKSGLEAIFYEKVTALPRNAAGNGYDKAGLRHTGQEVISITGISTNTYVPLKSIVGNDLLIEHLYSRKFSDLPQKIREDGGIWLQKEGLWPVGRGFVSVYYVISDDDNWASRGVAQCAKKIVP